MSDLTARTPRPRTRSSAAVDPAASPDSPLTELSFNRAATEDVFDDDTENPLPPPPPVPPTVPIEPVLLQTQLLAILQLLAENVTGRNRGVSTSSTRDSKEPKVKDPETFTGKRSLLNPFITECNLVFELQASRFNNERVKVNYMISYLRGTPLDAISPYLTALPRPSFIESYDEFIAYLRSNFGDPDEIGTTRRKYKALRQTTSAAAYFAELQQYLAINYKDQDPIVDNAIDGLKPFLKDELAKRPRPSTFIELREFVIPLDNRLYEREQEKKKDPEKPAAHTPSKSTEHRSSTRTVVDSTTTAIPAVIPIQLASKSRTTGYTKQYRPPVNQEEKDRRIRLDLCRYCGSPGHYASACPNVRTPPTVAIASKPNDNDAEKGQGSPA